MTVTSSLKKKNLKPENNAKKVLILGVGNILLRDEGVGVRVVEKIKNEHPLPDNVEVVDGGTLGLRLIPYLEGREAIFIVDAIDRGGKPGELFRIEANDIDDIYNARKLSAHQIGLREVLALSRLQNFLPKRVCLFGIQPQTVGIGLELSEPVSSRLDELIEMLLEEVKT
ncbi:MAG: HyaD/HybD family hydrogenase maturation endopeptidase [Candidatus Brocadiales bacterium]